jgi:hypothetical protein
VQAEEEEDEDEDEKKEEEGSCRHKTHSQTQNLRRGSDDFTLKG